MYFKCDLSMKAFQVGRKTYLARWFRKVIRYFIDLEIGNLYWSMLLIQTREIRGFTDIA